jgi:hypothetical protein
MRDSLRLDLREWHRFDSESHLSLGDAFFPVLDSQKVSPIARENSKMLHALVTCMERGNCHQNQTKGSLISTFVISTSYIFLQ